MKNLVSLICIGDELLKGKITNTHLTFIGAELLKNGIIPELQLTVKDNLEDIKNALNYCKNKSRIIILTGGLGPTTDDITVQTVADFFGIKLVQSSKALEELKSFLKFRGYVNISETNMKQTYIPETSEVISNPNGTAPGIKLKKDELTLFLLPGPPQELKPMFLNIVLPYILKQNNQIFFYESVYAVGVPESVFQEKVSELLGNSYNSFNVAFRAVPGLCELMISGKNQNEVNKAMQKVKDFYSFSLLSGEFIHPVEEVFDFFKKKNYTLATAESCTGGKIAAKITDIPGASLIFKGSVVAYSNEIKIKYLDVLPETIAQFGAVSSETAKEMVIGICKNFNANAGIAVTGIAGPDGGTPEKPVGLIYIAVKLFDKITVKKFLMKGSRETIRERTVITAIDELRKLLV